MRPIPSPPWPPNIRLPGPALQTVQRRLRVLEEQDHMFLQIYIGKTDGSGVSAMSVDTPGTGEVTLYRKNADGDLETILDGAGNALTVDVLNLAQTAVAASTYVQVKQEGLSGEYLVDFEDCG